MAVLCVVAGAVLAMGQATVARHRAGGAADLAALAAADHWVGGPADACARAERVARAQGARVVRCEVVGEVSDVTAAAEFGPFGTEVRSRAGPTAHPAFQPGRSPSPDSSPPGAFLSPPGAFPARPAFEDDAGGRQGARGGAP
ncbi:hypothetical protein GPA10_18145 [Streptomyces sp. p1417]|uniref:Putative Flp pilus-assembly TadG-like N-terminal domain-containing protein n=1 Tax=Streptomyces typhae TaxID=2681492 RepID=A0A6L6WYN3_9ACTN|nr:Rv3654c family TadE-like protein [Streptomyces typhae]MVO86628.1 hypothetical protein [Streptomyces typhae]